MNEIIAPDEFVKALEEAFESGHDLRFVPTGRSMRPMLDGDGDCVTLSPKPDRLRKNDVALYKRPKSGKLVLHRMIGFDKSGGYVFSGDSQYALEYGIKHEDILAVMTAFCHKGRERKVSDGDYCFYSRMILLPKAPLRLLARTYHKLFK